MTKLCIVAVLAGCLFSTMITTAGAENRCGSSFLEAASKCSLCPKGVDSECEAGEKCYVSLPACFNTRKLLAVSPGGGVSDLTSTQKANAGTIIKVGKDAKVPKRGLIVAITAALQESKLMDSKKGTKDSQGLFQQRPSAGWGSAAEVSDPVLSSKAFFGVSSHTRNSGLYQIRGWEKMTVAKAAQSVLVVPSATGFAQWEDLATKIVAQLG